MLKQVRVGDKTVCVGDKIRSKRQAVENEVCGENLMCEVKIIRDDGPMLIGLESSIRVRGWHDLDGLTKNGHGFWATRDCLLDNFELLSANYTISEDLEFKGHNLKGMNCKVIHISDRIGSAFVEVDKDIGAGSADGMGRRGRCVAVPLNRLTRVKDNESTEKWIEEGKNG